MTRASSRGAGGPSAGLEAHEGGDPSPTVKLAPIDRVLMALDAAGSTYRKGWGTDQYTAECPSHEDDDKSSLSIGVGEDERVLMKCFAGCTLEEICAALRLPISSLFRNGKRRPGRDRAAAEREAIAIRRCAALLSDTKRLAELEKNERWSAAAIEIMMAGIFGERVSIPERWASGEVTTNYLYTPHFERVRQSFKHQVGSREARAFSYREGGLASSTVVVVEGASCALATMTLGHEALSFPGVSAIPLQYQWRRLLRGKTVILLCDSSPRGRAAMDKIAAMILPVAAEVTRVDLWPERSDDRDIADLLREEGVSRAERLLSAKIDQAEPLVRRNRGRPRKARSRAETWLRLALCDGEWHDSAQVYEHAPRGVSKRTLADARSEMRIETRQVRVEGSNTRKHQMRNALIDRNTN